MHDVNENLLSERWEIPQSVVVEVVRTLQVSILSICLASMFAIFRVNRSISSETTIFTKHEVEVAV